MKYQAERGHPVRQRAQSPQTHEENRFERDCSRCALRRTGMSALQLLDRSFFLRFLFRARWGRRSSLSKMFAAKL